MTEVIYIIVCGVVCIWTLWNASECEDVKAVIGIGIAVILFIIGCFICPELFSTIT